MHLDSIDDDRASPGLHRSRQRLGRKNHYQWTYKAVIGTAVLLIAALPIACHHPLPPETQFSRVLLSFQHGELQASHELAGTLAKQFATSNPEWSQRFRIIEAESAAWRGMNPEVVQALSPRPSFNDPAIAIKRLSLLGLAHAHLHQYAEAEQELTDAAKLCSINQLAVCSVLLRSRAGLAIEHGQYADAYRLFSESLATARRFREPFEESAALMNLGGTCLLEERFDEAIDWLAASNEVANPIQAGDILLNNTGNLGWAYYKLGDSEKALGLLQDAEQRARTLGDTDGAITWLTTSGYVYQSSHELERAAESYQQAFELAKKINNKEELVNSLEDLAHVSIDAGKLEDAERYLRQLDPMMRAKGNRLDALDVMFAQGRIAAARHQDDAANRLFRAVESDGASQGTMRLGAEHEMARLLEAGGHTSDAKRMYETTLATFESARAQLTNDDSKLPFLANATRIYDDYIQFLIKQGKMAEALEAADQSRARTLVQGLGAASGKPALMLASLHPAEIARKSNATLLFYWLGETRSYLWAITPQKTALYPMPSQGEIIPLVERYRAALLGPNDPLDAANPDALALYQMLVAPAKDLIATNATVVILNDGALSQLNFETLVVPGATPHYWIEDATLISAPSLSMLASAKPSPGSGHKLLLLGDAVSPSVDYPELPEAAVEMQQIRRHFRSTDETVFARQQANSAAYLSSAPRQFSYIHFVAHGVASRTNPLDSAIILSRTAAAEDSFKLYAREIIQHPIDARLVTISACYGSGTRSYAGEGLVGLSWAFLRAGAHSVIGALWEVSDDSTPRLMDTLYQGLEEGMPPSAALRRAKLSLLHSENHFRRPFFWAPFQIYTGL